MEVNVPPQSGADVARGLRQLDAENLRDVADHIRGRLGEDGHAALVRVLGREQLAMINLLLEDSEADTREHEARWDQAMAGAHHQDPGEVKVAEFGAALDLDDEERVRDGRNPIGGD